MGERVVVDVLEEVEDEVDEVDEVEVVLWREEKDIVGDFRSGSVV